MEKRKMCFMCDVDGKGMDLLEKIYLENLKERRILLNSEIDASAIDTVVMQIKKFNFEDERNGVPTEERKPIEVYVTSYGGSCYDGFGVVNAITTSKTPVHTYCDAYVMSMGLAIFSAGHKRFAYPYSSFMYHEVSSGAFGKNEEIERVAAENKRLQKMYDALLISKTNLTQQKLDKMRKSLKDWHFGAIEAKEIGLVHEVIE